MIAEDLILVALFDVALLRGLLLEVGGFLGGSCVAVCEPLGKLERLCRAESGCQPTEDREGQRAVGRLLALPLSNLDAKLRVEMRSVIKRIQNDVGITTVYVTHDQEEAMAVSDRIAVMDQGVIQHIGTPKDISPSPSSSPPLSV